MEDLNLPELTYSSEMAQAYLKASGWCHAGSYFWFNPQLMVGMNARLHQDEAVKLQFKNDLTRTIFVFRFAKNAVLDVILEKAFQAFRGGSRKILEDLPPSKSASSE